MRNTMKVAKWEVKRNVKNKSFLIGLIITPLIFLFFMFVPSLLSQSSDQSVDLFIQDDIGVIEEIRYIVNESEFLDWKIHETVLDEGSMIEQLQTNDHMAYIQLTEQGIDDGGIPLYTSEKIDEQFMNQINALEGPLLQVKLEKLGLPPEDRHTILQGISFLPKSAEEVNETKAGPITDPLERIIPGIFAGIILFSIVMSGMMIFQSASQEKKDKIAEIILSSLTPHELMQGKIIGYFVIGMIQVLVWLAIAIPVIIWRFDIPIINYLLVPELAILLFIALLGYLLFAAIFVGIGATIEDVSTSGNFQGLVFMLPFLPLILLSPVLRDPNGIVAQVGSYIPFTAPGVLIMRLTMLEEWPWFEIILAIIVLIISVWLFMKLAGKIFKTGILLYGKNATPKEIWKWLWI